MSDQSAKSLPEVFHGLIATAIDVEGVFPHQCMFVKDGKSTLCALMVSKPHEVYQAVLSFLWKDKPDELIFGLDRFCKEGQGTTLKDSARVEEG